MKHTKQEMLDRCVSNSERKRIMAQVPDDGSIIGCGVQHPMLRTVCGINWLCPKCQAKKDKAEVKEEVRYYILSLKHTHLHDFVFTWWGPNSCGYTPDLNKAGKYLYSELSKEYIRENNENKETFAIECSIIDKIAVELEYNYNEWEAGRFIINNEVFYNTFNIKTFLMIQDTYSNAQYFRYIKG